MVNLRNVEKKLKAKGIENIEVTRNKKTYYILHILKNGNATPIFTTNDKDALYEHLENAYKITVGKGWRETADSSGKAPRHRAVSTKKKTSAIRRTPQEQIYYSSNSSDGSFTFKQFVDSEIKEMRNYPNLNVNSVKKKYGITDRTKVIWVTLKKWIANRYNLLADDYYNAENIPEDEMGDVYEYSSKNGFLITETNDGDEGFLYVWRNQS